MSDYDKFRGHSIELIGDSFYYVDNGDPVAATWEQRPCGHCGLANTPEGYDGCMGEIKGAINACCGHGNNKEAYVQYADGTIIR